MNAKSRAKILMVDDDSDLVHILSLALTKRGYDVVSASDGEEGLSMVDSEKPDLILLDVVMPRLDGFGFVRRLKKNPLTQKIPAMVLTSMGWMRDIFEKEGVRDYFLKSSNMEDVFTAIEKRLKEKQAPPSP